MAEEKRCTVCATTKPLESFPLHNQQKDGRDPRCKACKRESSRAHYEKNRERLKKTRKKWYAANRESHLARTRAYNKEHREQRMLWMRKWRALNPERAKEISARRRARIRSQPYEVVDYAKVLERDKGICYLCEKPVTADDLHFDHVIPIARGGGHTYSNVRVSHGLCNREKSSALIERFVSDPELYAKFTYPEIRATVRPAHCPHGHPYEGANIIWVKGKYRLCRTCRNAKAKIREREKRARKRAERETA